MFDWVKDALQTLLNGIGSSVDADTVRLLTQTPAEYAPHAYSLVKSISVQAIKPVAMVILAIVFTLEILKVGTRMDSDSQLGVKMVMSALLKIIIIYSAAMHADWLADGITELVNQISRGVSHLVTTGGATVSGSAAGLGDTLAKNGGIDNSNLGQQIVALVILVIPFLLSKFLMAVVRVLIVLRFVELFVMTSFGALPIAFLAFDATRSWGEGYIRQYGSVAMSNVTLLIALGVYNKFSVDMFHINAAKTTLNQIVFTNFMSLVGLSVLLIGLVVVSQQASKALFGQV